MATSTPQTVNSGLLSAPQENAAVTFLAPNAMGLLSTMAAQPQALMPPPPVPTSGLTPSQAAYYARLPQNEDQSKYVKGLSDFQALSSLEYVGKKPSMKEFMDKTGVDASTASDLLYGVVGSNKETRNWNAIMASNDPVAAARQATADMYGGIQQRMIKSPTSNEMIPQLFSNTGINLTQAKTGRDINFGVGLTPTQNSNLVSGPEPAKLPANISGYDAGAILSNRYGITGPIGFGEGVTVNYGTGQVAGRSASDPSVTGGSIIAGRGDPAVMQKLDANTLRFLQSLPKPQSRSVQSQVNKVPPQVAQQAAPIQPQINAQQQQALQQRAQQRQALQTAIQSAASAAPRQTSASRYAPGLPNIGMAAEDFYRYLTQNLIQPRVMNKDTIAKKG